MVSYYKVTLTLTLVLLTGCATDRAMNKNAADFEMPDDVAGIVFQAKKAELEGQYQSAITRYQAALDKDKNDLAAQLGLAGVYLRQGVVKQAEPILTAIVADSRCLELLPPIESEPPVNALANATGESGLASKTAHYCAVAWNGKGVISDLAGDYAAAEQHYLAAIRYREDDATFYNNYGYSLIMAHRYEQAEQVLLQAYSLAPNSTRVRNNLAYAQAWLGKYDEALSTFSETLEDPEAFNNIGYIALLQRQYDKAIQLFERAIALSPTYYVKAANNLQKVKRLQQASRLKRESPAASATGSVAVSSSEVVPAVSYGVSIPKLEN